MRLVAAEETAEKGPYMCLDAFPVVLGLLGLDLVDYGPALLAGQMLDDVLVGLGVLQFQMT